MAARPITLMLREFAAGDKNALDQVIPLVYAELRKLATRHLNRERGGETFQPTALVHEAYLKLVGQDQPDYQKPGPFLCCCSTRNAPDSYRSRTRARCP